MSPMTPAEKQAASRRRLEAQGGQVVTARLTPKAKAKLDAIREKRGTSVAETINGLLERSRP